MNNKETGMIISFLNSSWSQNTLAPETAAIWGSELSRFEFRDVMDVVRAIARTSKWRPSLAEILEPLVVPVEAESSGEAFSKLWREITRVGASGTPELSDRALRAVRHLGGWAAVCTTWRIDERNWHRKEFCKEFEEVESQENRDSLRALGGRVAPQSAIGPVARGASD